MIVTGCKRQTAIGIEYICRRGCCRRSILGSGWMPPLDKRKSARQSSARAAKISSSGQDATVQLPDNRPVRWGAFEFWLRVEELPTDSLSSCLTVAVNAELFGERVTRSARSSSTKRLFRKSHYQPCSSSNTRPFGKYATASLRVSRAAFTRNHPGVSHATWPKADQ